MTPLRGNILAMMLLMAGVSELSVGCETSLNQNSTDSVVDDPYLAFSNAVTEVEPLINPELDALTGEIQAGQQLNLDRQSVNSLPPINPLNVEGHATVITESTLLPLNERLYQRFVNLGYTGIIDLKSLSISKAIQEFCDRKTGHLLTIKRPLTLAEKQRCEGKGRAPIAFPLAKDALLIVVNQPDRFVRGINTEKLRSIFSQEQWSSVDPNWPQAAIHREIMGPDSTAVDLLAQQLFQGNSTPILNAPKTNFFADVGTLVQAMMLTPHSVSFISHSIYQTLPQRYRVIPINGISGSPDTIQSGVYPLHQTVYLYLDRTQFQTASRTSTPTLPYALSNLYLTHINQVVGEVAFLPLPEAQLNQSIRQWLDRAEKK